MQSQSSRSAAADEDEFVGWMKNLARFLSPGASTQSSVVSAVDDSDHAKWIGNFHRFCDETLSSSSELCREPADFSLDCLLQRLKEVLEKRLKTSDGGDQKIIEGLSDKTLKKSWK